MNPDQIVALGTYCEALMRDDTFNALCGMYREQLYTAMMSTKPHETKMREGLYAEGWGLHNFLAMMKGFVDARDVLLNEATEQSAGHHPASFEEQDFE